MAFDTGPGNMVVDRLMQVLFDKPFDRDGAVARKGIILKPILEELLDADYFKLKPPKTAGREEFGRAICRSFSAQLRQVCQSGRNRHGHRAYSAINGAGREALCSEAR